MNFKIIDGNSLQFHTTQYPIIQSFEPGKFVGYYYIDDLLKEAFVV